MPASNMENVVNNKDCLDHEDIVEDLEDDY